MTADAVDKALLVIEAAWPNWKPKPQTVLLWRALLVPLEREIVERAVMEFVISPREFAPSVGELIDLSSRLKLEVSGQRVITAEEGWAEVQDAIERLGYYRNPEFKNPATSSAVAALGWQRLCTDPNVTTSRAHFFRLFDAYQERQLREHRVAFMGELSALIENTTKALEYMN